MADVPSSTDDQKLSIFFDLSISEVILFGVMAFVAPLIFMGLPLAFELRIASVLLLAANTYLLLFYKYEGENMLYWLSKILPFIFKERVFFPRNERGKVSPRLAALDEATVLATNNLFTVTVEELPDRVRVHIREESAMAERLANVYREPGRRGTGRLA